MKKVGKERINWPVTILLIAGLITVVFPLYMTVVIALKKPSEMTNDVAGILSLPKHFSLSNFTEAMKVTDFWNSLGNSLLITVVTVVLAMLIHSLLGYAIARNKAHSKFYKFIYFYVVSGMFVPFAILMMPVVKQTAQMGLANRAGVIILYLVFYMPMNVLLYSGYLTNIPMALEEAAKVDGAGTVTRFFRITLPMLKPTIILAVFLSITSSLQCFDLIYTMTGGGPNNASTTLVIYAYSLCFAGSSSAGYAMAVSNILFVVILVIAMLQRGMMKREASEI